MLQINRLWLQIFLIMSFSMLFLAFIDDEYMKITTQIVLITLLFVISIQAYIRERIFEPDIFFLLSLLLYFLMGGLNFSWLPFIEVDYVHELTCLIFLIGFSIPMIFYKPLKLSYFFISDLSVFIGFCLFVLGPLGWIGVGGIPLLMGEDARRGTSAIMAVLFQTGWILALYLHVNSVVYDQVNRRGILNVLLALYVVALFLSAYRTPLLIGLLVYLFLFFSCSKKKRRDSVKLFLAAILFLVVTNLMSMLRVYTEYGIDGVHSLSEKLDTKTSSIQYISIPLISNFKESALNYQSIRNSGFYYGHGSYFISNLLSILPGESTGYGTTYNKLSYAETNRTKTATIVAPGYIFGGEIGVFLSGFMFALLSVMLTFFSKNSSLYGGSFALSALYYAFLSIWIHTGIIMQPGNYLVFSFLIFLSFFTQYLDDFSGLPKKHT
jgi:hypothetical protein